MPQWYGLRRPDPCIAAQAGAVMLFTPEMCGLIDKDRARAELEVQARLATAEAQRLVEQNHAADELAEVCRSEQQFPAS